MEVDDTTDPMACPRCGVALGYRGTAEFHAGGGGPGTHFFLGEVADLFTGREKYDVYVCPRCGRIELFLDGVGEEFRPH